MSIASHGRHLPAMPDPAATDTTLATDGGLVDLLAAPALERTL